VSFADIGNPPAKISREELYRLVWTEPMTKVAPRFGLSDVGLAKVCRKYHIPRPPVGYWAKLGVGHHVEPSPCLSSMMTHYRPACFCLSATCTHQAGCQTRISPLSETDKSPA
jgi:hypothetical protein